MKRRSPEAHLRVSFRAPNRVPGVTRCRWASNVDLVSQESAEPEEMK